MKKEIILIGGGGHCKSCIDVIEKEGVYKVAGIVDVEEKVGGNIMGYPVIGTDEDLNNLALEYDYFLITLGQIKTAELRIKLFNKVKKMGKSLPVILSPNAYVSKYAKVEEGSIIMHGAIVNSEAHIGKNCIINTKSLIEHDSVIGDHCHISTSSVINGCCRVGESCILGTNSTLIHNVSVCNLVTIGAGSVVLHDVNQSGIYVGIPAKMKL